MAIVSSIIMGGAVGSSKILPAVVPVGRAAMLAAVARVAAFVVSGQADSFEVLMVHAGNNMISRFFGLPSSG